MNKEQVARINALGRKAAMEGLTPEEAQEQQALRTQYLKEFRENMKQTLDNTYVIGLDGVKRPLKKKVEPEH